MNFEWMFQHMEEKHGLHHTLQDKLEFYWKEFSNALKMYQENNQDRKLAFEELKAKDDDSAQEIDAQMRKLTRISVGSLHFEMDTLSTGRTYLCFEEDLSNV